jgi:hypothetical protein
VYRSQEKSNKTDCNNYRGEVVYYATRYDYVWGSGSTAPPFITSALDASESSVSLRKGTAPPPPPTPPQNSYGTERASELVWKLRTTAIILLLLSGIELLHPSSP